MNIQKAGCIVTLEQLASAIMEGSKLRPQGSGMLAQQVWVDGHYEVHTCALGAALEYILGRPPVEVKGTLHTYFRGVTEWRIPYPPDTRRPGKDTVWRVICFLNDNKRWPRERIAGYLRHLANAQANEIEMG